MSKVTRRSFATGLMAGTAALAARRPVYANTSPSVQLDVLVIGAGLSGLESALLLEQLGARVQVIEARHRVGGRVYTLFDRPGYPEVGGNGFAAGYGRVLHRAKALGLPLQNNTPRRMKDYADIELVLDSKIYSRRRWPRSSANPLPKALRQQMPWEVSGSFLSAHNPLKSVDGWLSPSSAPLDVALHDWLAGRGLDDRTIDLCWSTNPYFGSSAYAVSALQTMFNDVWTQAIGRGSSASYGIVGGNQLLPMAMARHLRNEVHLGREVSAMRDDGRTVEVLCRDGSRYRAKTVICSIPFAALRTMRFDAPLSGPQAEAIAALPYMINTLVFFVPKRKFWEVDGLGPTMWTDGPVGMVAPQRFGKTAEEVTAYVANPRGNMAAWVDRLPPAEAVRVVQQAIEQARPAARGALEGGMIFSWARQPFSGGDWAVYGPGQINRFARELALPHGRIHFCGEHTARSNEGMEGAFESAERVVPEIAEQL